MKPAPGRPEHNAVVPMLRVALDLTATARLRPREKVPGDARWPRSQRGSVRLRETVTTQEQPC